MGRGLPTPEAAGMRREVREGCAPLRFSVQGWCWGLGRLEAGWPDWCQAASAGAERPHCWCSGGLWCV